MVVYQKIRDLAGKTCEEHGNIAFLGNEELVKRYELDELRAGGVDLV